ncbi:MAG: CapA family protein [Deltaproteobacteria bacterium]|nr:CapA family protein [Deltaproteobacteria bacterium]
MKASSSDRFLCTALGIALVSSITFGCKSPHKEDRQDAASPAPVASLDTPAEASAPPAASQAPVPLDGPLVLIAGGDVDLSRGTGQRILRDPSWDPFVDVRPWLTSADVRFANLESPLSDQKGVTVNKDNPLVFTGPPSGAEVLLRGAFDVVSTANNHSWDYGKRGLVETIENLDRVGIAHVGTNGEAQSPIGPLLLERKGHKLAFFAMTAIFNDGPANLPEPRKYTAPANLHVLRAAIAEVRDKVDRVVVSVHLGNEYSDEPVQIYRSLLFGAIDSGADVVLGHHTHTPQRIEFHKSKPVVFSLGNFVFHQHSEHPWTGWGYLARVRFDKGAEPTIELCPYHLLASVPHPVKPAEESMFLAHFKAISIGAHTGQTTRRADDGCWSVEERRP